MKIAVIGAGAMGSIYGGHLSLQNEVWLVDTNQETVEHIQKNGLILQEEGQDITYHPSAVTSSEGLPPMDLVILFVKALYSRSALSANRELIGPDTFLMTLQNGSGHEDILSEFVPADHIIIGTTEDNGAVLAPGYVRRGGTGKYRNARRRSQRISSKSERNPGCLRISGTDSFQHPAAYLGQTLY